MRVLAAALVLATAGAAQAADKPFTQFAEDGPYLTMANQSAAVKTEDGLIFTAGIIGMDPKTRKFASLDPAAQMRQAMDNLEATLKAAGADLSDVVQFTLWVGNEADYPAINAVYVERMAGTLAARTVMGFTPWSPSFKVQVQAVAKVRPVPAPVAGLYPPSMTPVTDLAQAITPKPPQGWTAPKSLADIPNCTSPVLMAVFGAVSEAGFQAPAGARAGYGQALREARLYERLGGHYLMSGRPAEVFEGDWTRRDMALVAEFPCLEAARAFYWGPEYQEILKLRAGAGQFTLAVWPKRTPEMMRR